ncbi:bifunctional hydroxymethylpyrimidine kinase/phosphomethylpyrimidine kinase [Fundidesulfovibrio butyratiphilus]
MNASLPCVLTIAGSDSSGGAGVQADLKAFCAHGCYGASVITALTAQNTRGVTDIFAPPAAFVGRQLEAVLTDLDVKAAKTGMLFDAAIVERVAESLAGKRFPLVLDPVCVSKSGHDLLKPEAVDALKRMLVPLADLVTPNRPEAERLSGLTIEDDSGVRRAMEALLALGPGAVLIKGGHMPSRNGQLTDWLGLADGTILPLTTPRVDTVHTHGTGCTLSASIASRLALGEGLEKAVRTAQAYLRAALASGFPVGAGVSPPNHLVGLSAWPGN